MVGAAGRLHTRPQYRRLPHQAAVSTLCVPRWPGLEVSVHTGVFLPEAEQANDPGPSPRGSGPCPALWQSIAAPNNPGKCPRLASAPWLCPSPWCRVLKWKGSEGTGKGA